MFSEFNGELPKSGGVGDTTLRLDCCGYGRREAAIFDDSQTKSGVQDVQKYAPDDGCKLVLGLGPSPNSFSYDYSPAAENKNKDLGLNQGLFTERDSILKLGLSGGIDEFSSVIQFSAPMNYISARSQSDQVPKDDNQLSFSVVDEGSTSAKISGGYLSRFVLTPRMDNGEILMTKNKFLEFGEKSHCQPSQLCSEPSAISNYSVSTVTELATAAVASCLKTSNTNRCKYAGCAKGARGATGLCISHGGGERCQRPGCNKGAESRTAYCKFHGGGRRCQHLGCTKSAEGTTDYCIAHGGGRRCEFPGGCTKAARGKSGLCIRHGGGKRCMVEGCTRSAEGQVGLCISHGGGRRCQFLGCSKGAQGSTIFCKAHGGGKRCIFAGCTKGAEGSTPLCKGHGGGKRCLFDGGGICPKSVHGGTNFCVAHGGGKRCAFPDCTKSARGKSNHCVRHGGGKRCKFENCGKSAQGSTEFCKAHGGGKRCNWGEGKCEKFARGRSGLCAAHSSLVHGRETSKTGMIASGLFHGLVPVTTKAWSSNTSSSGVSMISDTVNSFEKLAKRQQLIPPQVLVPLSMKTSSSYSRSAGSEQQEKRNSKINLGSSDNGKSFSFVVPEGRVHGGGILSLLGGNLKNVINGI